MTVLNGHIHQIVQKVEGNVSFTPRPVHRLPATRTWHSPSPGPMKVPSGELHKVLGIASVNFVRGSEPLAIIDTPLAG